MRSVPRGGAWKKRLAVVALGCGIGLVASAGADELDDLIGGFDGESDSAGEDRSPEEPAREPSSLEPREPSLLDNWDLTGSVSLASSVAYRRHRSPDGTQWGGLSKLRSKLNLQLDGDLPRDWKLRANGYAFYDFAYIINGRDYTSQVLDEYEWEVEFQEGYLQGSLRDDLDLKLGRQIVNWGRSDSLRVLDVINPLDNREPGLADIEDLRLPLAMVKLDYFWEQWTLTGLVIPEIRFNRNPPFGSDFNPSLVPLPESEPDSFSSDLEYGLALTGIFRGWDISFHGLRYWDDLAILNPTRSGLVHSQLWMVGAGGNYTIGSWLLKTELAYIDGFHFPRIISPMPLVVVFEESSRLDFMAGIEYYGINDWQFALEIANRHLFDFSPFMGSGPSFAQENTLETALRVTANFFNSRLQVTGLAILLGERAQDGSIVRLSGSYALRDALNLEGGILLFQSGDALLLQSFGQNDRLFLELKYSF